CALEPEISDMIDFLCEMGAKISGKNTSVITVEGVEKLNGCTYEVIPDRIEAGTWMILGALKGKELVVEGVIREHLESLFSTFDSIGIPYVYDSEKRTFKISAVPFSELNGAVIDTAPFPGFPTDLQPQIMVLLALINGKSIISEKIFNRRYYHIDELNRMGAKINVDETNAIIQGVEKLTGAPVQATDLRAAAALVLAGITAEGETVISNVDHIFRGYEKIIEKLSDIDIKIRYAI
ncbi:MAG TPA: UDP-N-acetylglucosamine 1-carboxyvinyltransferase, partial [Tepiditoga sp.]|nr:UDP-N-acetylglucosamine 1-carboxyvinyltransferase [Tepiditoga sp.]